MCIFCVYRAVHVGPCIEFLKGLARARAPVVDMTLNSDPLTFKSCDRSVGDEKKRV